MIVPEPLARATGLVFGQWLFLREWASMQPRMKNRPVKAASKGITLNGIDDGPVMSPNEVGALLGVTGEAVKQWIYTRKLPAVKLRNGYWIIKPADLQRFLHARRSVKPKLLLVARDSALIAQLQQLSEILLCDVTTTTNVSDAMLKVADQYPALCIIDLSSVSECWSLLEKITTRRKRIVTPVLLVSNEDLSTEQLETAVRCQVRGCQLKPIDGNELQTVITNILKV